MGHFNEFILDMACLFNAVIFSGKGSGTDEDVADTDFAATVGLTVVASKAFNHHAGKFCFAIEEDHVIRDEDVIEDDQGFLTAKFCVSKIDVGAVFHLAGIAGLTAIDHVEAFGVGRAGKADGPILIGFLHGDGGHEDVPMGIDGTCLVNLGAADDNAVRTAFHDMDEDVRVFLFMRRLGAVPFRIRHGAVYGQVIILDVDEELLEVFVVMGAVFFVDFIGRGVYGVEGVHTDAALEAAGCFLTEKSLHLDFLDEVFRGLVQMGETVDGVARQVARCCHEVLIFWILGQGIGHGNAVDGRTNDGMVDPVVDFFPKHIDSSLQFA